MILREIGEIEDKRELMTPSVEWMARKYDEMNQTLFGGELGACSFKIFTTGKGSQGGVLGWFRITTNSIRYEKDTRRMFYNGFLGVKIYITQDNFVNLCKPQIELNGNYRWTERAALSTLVHEMCHYYTDMKGIIPRQAHGREFKQIASHVSSLSNGIFTVERLAKAEQMQEMELDNKYVEMKQRRLENKKNKMIILLIYKDNGQIRLINCNSQTLAEKIVSIEKKRNDSTIKMSTNNELKDFLFSKGYKKAFTTYRFWPIENKPWVKNLDNFPMNTVYSNKGNNMTNTQPEEKKIPVFRIVLNGGQTFELKNVTEDELRQALRTRFPNWNDEAVERVAATDRYRISESKIRKMVKEALEEELGQANDDIGIITPDMNLGIINLN
jgi:predicted SprT family Zn-dependent metalloprotease